MTVYKSPEKMAKRVRDLLCRYNVMSQVLVEAFFPGEEKAVRRAVKSLEKSRQIYRNPYTGFLASNEFSYGLKDNGTMCCLWVLADVIKRKTVEAHFLAEHEDFPVRILFISSQELYDILYVGPEEVQLVNGLYAESRRPGENHLVVLEKEELIDKIRIPNVTGYCVVREGEAIAYYRRKQGVHTA